LVIEFPHPVVPVRRLAFASIPFFLTSGVSSVFMRLLAALFPLRRAAAQTHNPADSNRMRGSRTTRAHVLMMDKTSQGIWAFFAVSEAVCAGKWLAPLLLKLPRNYWSWNDQARVRNNNCQNET
jgi:hypothetical protein